MATRQNNNNLKITSDNVLDALINLKQIVFEVTDACNLQCKYCAYGDLYFGFDKRNDSYLSIEKGKAILDYLFSIWKTHSANASSPTTFVSFYGGEPLMNMDFITTIVEYIESKKLNRNIIFSLTTNGILLKKNIGFFAEHNFNLLVSLDGDEKASGHRVTRNGKNSFPIVFSNLKEIQKQYPDYFEKHINFNTVLHNLNSVESSYKFIKEEFKKEPIISELNNANIRQDKIDDFYALYKNKAQSIENSTNCEDLTESMMVGSPKTRDLLLYLHKYSGNVYSNYSDLFIDEKRREILPTGTCIPFAKKMFITVNGKIIQCEKIPQRYSLGVIDENNVVILDYNLIAQKYNALIDKVRNQCNHCYRKKGCIQCLYYIPDIDKDAPYCQGFMNKRSFEQYSRACLSHLYSHPDLYETLLNDIIID